MTDAGFHAAWFKLAAKHGWSYVGRIRGRDMVQQGDDAWIRATTLCAQATLEAQDLGHCGYLRSNCIECRLVLVKRLPRGQHRLNLYGHRRLGRASQKCARSGRDPWLLAASSSLGHLSAESIVKLYGHPCLIRVHPWLNLTASFRLRPVLEFRNPRWGK